LLITALASVAYGQGALTPSGAPAPSMKTLDQIYNAITNLGSTVAFTGEKRIDVLSLSADSFALHAITQPGSYYLSTNILGVNGGSICGFSVEADNVTVDLNGFSLLGNGDNYSGVWIVGVRTNLTIKNGIVSAWGNVGIYATDGGKQLRLECLQCNQNKGGAGGFYVPGMAQAYIKDCLALGNGGPGFTVAQGSVVEGCTASGNTTYGINVNSDCVVRNCLVFTNGGGGITLGSRCDAEHNTCTYNTGNGIYCPGNDTRIDSNQCLYNTLGFYVTGTDNIVVRNTGRNLYNGSDAYSIANGNIVGSFIYWISGSIVTISAGSGWENFDCYVIP